MLKIHWATLPRLKVNRKLCTSCQNWFPQICYLSHSFSVLMAFVLQCLLAQDKACCGSLPSSMCNAQDSTEKFRNLPHQAGSVYHEKHTGHFPQRSHGLLAVVVGQEPAAHHKHSNDSSSKMCFMTNPTATWVNWCQIHQMSTKGIAFHSTLNRLIKRWAFSQIYQKNR